MTATPVKKRAHPKPRSAASSAANSPESRDAPGAAGRCAASLVLEAGWPIEVVTGQVAVATPRALDPIEWALIAACLALGGAVDPVEMAEALGLGDAVLVDDAADGLVALGALERREGGLAVTAQGQARFATGQVDLRPAWHGLSLVFDGLTEGLLLDQEAPTGAPCVAPEALAAPPRQALDLAGLAQDPAVARLCKGDGRVVGARVDDSRFASTAVKIGLEVVGGRLVPTVVVPEDLEGGRLRFVAERGVDPAVLAPLAQALPFVDATPHDPQPLGSPRTGGAEPLEALEGAIGVAKSWVLVHGALAAVAGLGKALRRACRRGVTVVELAPADGPLEVVDLHAGSPLGLWVRVPARLSAAPAALVVDGQRALAVATRTLKAAWDGSPVAVRSLDDHRGDDAAPAAEALRAALIKAARPAAREGVPTGLAVAFALRAVGVANHRIGHHFKAALGAADADWAALWPLAPDEAARAALVARARAAAGAVRDLDRVAALAPLLCAEERRRLGEALAAALAPGQPGFAAAVPVLKGLLAPEALAELAHAWCAGDPGADLEGWLRARQPLLGWGPGLPAAPLLERLGTLRGLEAVARAGALVDALGAAGLDAQPVGPVLGAALAASAPEALPVDVYLLLGGPVLGPPLVEWAWRGLPEPAPETFSEDLSIVLSELPPEAHAPLAEAAVLRHREALRALKGGVAWEGIQKGWQALGLRREVLDRGVGKGSGKVEKSSKNRGKRR